MKAGPRLLGLVADIGGTNARFGLAFEEDGRARVEQIQKVPGSAWPNAAAAIGAYLDRCGARPLAAVLAVAGIVRNGEADLTNSAWRLSEAALGRSLGGAPVRLLNDYEALALAFAGGGDAVACRPIGAGRTGQAQAPLIVMGAGTGFGLSALVRTEGRSDPVSTEAGHVGFAPGDELEIEILRALARRFGRATIEHILSGPGLLNLHRALGDIDGIGVEAATAEAITGAAEREDPRALRTVATFWRIMARTAGDFALTYGALGGVFLAGGVTAHLAPFIDEQSFRTHFEDKGRFGETLRAVPTQLITDPYAAMIGAAHRLRSIGGGRGRRSEGEEGRDRADRHRPGDQV